MKIKKCFIDVETTGLDVSKHSIHQISSIMIDENGKEIDSFNMKLRPFKAEYEQSALDIAGITYAELLEPERETSGACFLLFQEFLNKHVNRFNKKDRLQFVAYNSEFDERFVREWFNEHDDSFYGAYFWNPSICVMKTAAWFLRDHRAKLNSFKLKAICNFAGIKFDENLGHDSMYDITKTLELYRVLEK